MSIAIFLVTLGLAARLTRLFVRDSITQPLRDNSQALWVSHSKWNLTKHRWSVPWYVYPVKFVSEMWECDWCTGIWATWFAFALAASPAGDTKTYFYVAAAASAAYLIGIGASIEDRLHGEEWAVSDAAPSAEGEK